MDWLELIFPRSCVNCHKAGRYLCQKCLLHCKLANLVCPACKRFSLQGQTHPSCRQDIYLDGAIAIWRYEEVIRKAILKLKYNFVSDIAQELVDVSTQDLKSIRIFTKSAVLIPIPLHRKRNNWRGFNQSEKLANALSESLSVPLTTNFLIRTQAGVNQATLDRETRLRNMRGKYAVNPDYVLRITSYARVILVDDVWTTGSTLNEAARVLKEAGIKEVWGLTIAR